MKKPKKDYYNKKFLASAGDVWLDITGKKHLTKRSAQITSFFIVVYGRFRTGFPIVVNRFWFSAIAIYPFILIRKDSVTVTKLNHEMIHIRQQFEMLIVFAYLWYAVEIIIRSIMYLSIKKAYYRHSMERECNENQFNDRYLLERKPYAFLKYLK